MPWVGVQGRAAAEVAEVATVQEPLPRETLRALFLSRWGREGPPLIIHRTQHILQALPEAGVLLARILLQMGVVVAQVLHA